MSGLPTRLLFIALAASSTPAGAGGAWRDSPLGKARFGEPWTGPAVAPEALEGKVVLVKSWAEW